jgi:hypothetical protein
MSDTTEQISQQRKATGQSPTSYGAFQKYGVQNASSNCNALNKDVWVFAQGKLEKLRSLP